MNVIQGGVSASQGFTAAGIHAGLRKNKSKLDLAMILCDVECAAAAVYTKNAVKAAPIFVTMENLSSGKARAVICNSGNANACAPDGEENARRMCAAAAKALGINENSVIVASTGVIGQRLNIEAIEQAVPALAKLLSREGSSPAAEAIMTTDLRKKELALSFDVGGKKVVLGGIAKGSGMIHPNMGTMLCFMTTDCAISTPLLQLALSRAVKRTFNRVSIDGDTSTNDMCAILASGLAGNKVIDEENEDFSIFYEALETLMRHLAREIARDGEGATKLLTCTVRGADSEDAAETLAKAVIASSLVKTMMFGSDANWGRILCAMGYSGAAFDKNRTDISFSSREGYITVAKCGLGIGFGEDLAYRILKQDEVTIDICIGDGDFEATAWGCDLSYEYVKINGEYRT